MESSISIKNISKIYKTSVFNHKGITALDNVNFSIEKGIIFGLLGPNGAGKTTLIKILLGIVFPTNGKAAILNKNINDYTVRQKVGYLPENHKFPNYLTGEEVILYYARLSGMKISKNSPEIEDVLKLVKMDKWRKVKIKKYSKGMMQRLGLAQAIIHNPDIIFLDEPTDGVDPIGRKEIRDILIQLKNQGKTIFINSHLLSEVELVSDKVAILNEGKLIKFGTVDELTVSKQVCEIKTENHVPKDLLNKLMKNYMLSMENDIITLEINGTNSLNNFMDELRSEGINIISVNQKKTSLENLFIESLTEKKN